MQKAIKEKGERRKERDLYRNENTAEAFKKANMATKRAIAKAKAVAYEDLYKSLEEEEGLQKAIRIAKQKNKESQDVYQVKRMKDENGQVLSDRRGRNKRKVDEVLSATDEHGKS